jgi:arginyl-tRNA synthetase
LLRSYLAKLFLDSIEALVSSGVLPAEVREVPVEIIDPKNPEHGDFACNFAMMASKKAGKNPRELAELLKAGLESSSEIESVDVAGPGFINLTLHQSFVAGFVGQVLELGVDGLARSAPAGSGQKINVEFVSVNPNGPITIGSGRGAAYGSTLCNVLEAAGNTVHREYYINDGVNSEQMRLFAESVRSLVKGETVPENGYKGDYVQEVANFFSNLKGWVEKSGKPQYVGRISWNLADTIANPAQINKFIVKHCNHEPTELKQSIIDSPVADIQFLAQEVMIDSQRAALDAFGVEYDTWFSEQSLHDAGTVAAEIDSLEHKGIADTQTIRRKLKLAKGNKVEEVIVEEQSKPLDDEGNVIEADESAITDTLWLRSTKLGDDMDRVLKRKDGRLTYIASDVAYHKDKFNRPAGADKLITILGPDHHGYIGRLTAVVAAMRLESYEIGEPCENDIDRALYAGKGEKEACEKALALAKEQLEVQIYQLVRFMKDGKPAPMRKRDGNIYALIDLMKEIGAKMKPESPIEEQLKAGRDVARFFYLMRSHDTTFDFDLDLAEKQSDENPVFYVQYAHARIQSILTRAASEINTTATSFELLTHEREKALIKKIVDLSDEVRRAAADYGVHRIATYAIELARSFHAFYDQCKVIQPDQPALSSQRLALGQATQIALKSALNLLGVSAPDRM